MKPSEDIIYVDHSILSTVAACKEKGRLSYVEHLRPIEEPPPLVFGSAFHAAIAAYYTAVSEDRDIVECKRIARDAFNVEVKKAPDGTLPIHADGKEKRSVERGHYLIDAYIDKWRQNDAHWSDIINPLTNKPYIEVGFAHYFMEWKGRPVVYVGKIDRLRKNRVDGQIYNWETKTTSTGLSYYMEYRKPNHQVTGYDWIASEVLGIKVAATIWDAIFISNRKVDGKYPNGVDSEKDFDRAETRRTPTDIKEFLSDLQDATIEFLSLRDSQKSRWHRNAPGACNMFGGCHFRDICLYNLNPRVIETKYRRERWEPWTIVPEETKQTRASDLVVIP